MRHETLRRLRSRVLLRRLALASVIANVVIVVTGGAVRLTSSGLGCPTWPSCTDSSLTPTKAYSFHGIIEFTNRQLTFVLSAIVLATLIVALVSRVQRKLALVLAASIPAQAVLGGITVLTHLNPWAVASHFLLSMAIIAVAFALWWQLQGPVTGRAITGSRVTAVTTASSAALARCSIALMGITAAVLAVGTVVTGSGPHAGAVDTGNGGKIHRIQLSPASVSQLHADLVMLLIGLSVGFVLLARSAGASPKLQRAAVLLLLVELAQGLIGYVQYFTGVPAVLVGFHMLGACLVWLAALALVAHAAPRTSQSDPLIQPIREDRRTLAG